MADLYADSAPGGSRWRLGALIPAVLGLVAAGYLTIEHYTSSSSLACPETGAINCAKVTTSSYSRIAGVPVALAGLVYFMVMIGLLTPAAWHSRRLDALRVAGVALGVVSVFYLVWAELFRINAICLWCTVVHVCTVAMFAGVIWYTMESRSDDAPAGKPPRPVRR
ncbi:MAG TPA: vitamin K epoxide reductase family protein [Jatrophihabitans sp.]